MRFPMIGGIAALALAAAPAAAETLTLGLYGGSFEKAMREIVVPAFQKQHKVEVRYVAGNSTDTLARLQAQKSKQEMDVVFLDDGVMFQAVALGFCAPLADGPVYNELYDIARIPGKKAVAAGFVGTGITFNKKYFAERNWAAPTSWKDIADPKFKKLLAISPITGTYGLHTLVMMARVNGGDERNIEPGFKAMQAIAGNVISFPTSPAQMSEALQSGEVVIAPWGSGRTVALANTGFPVDFVYPREGAVALMIGVCPVAKPDVSNLAQTFIQFNLTADMQAVFAKEQGFGPVNKNTTLAPEIAKLVPYGVEQVAKLVAVDWDLINKEREAWTKRWQREIER